MKKIFSLILVMVLMFCILPVGGLNVSASASGTKYVTVSGKNTPVWDHAKSTGNSKKIASLAPGTIVTIVSTHKNLAGNTWGKIANRGESYIFMDNLTTYKEPSPITSLDSDKQAYVTTKNNVIIYADPSSYSARERTLSAAGTSVSIEATHKNAAGNIWGRIKGSNGWIYMGNLTEFAPQAKTALSGKYVRNSNTFEFNSNGTLTWNNGTIIVWSGNYEFTTGNVIKCTSPNRNHSDLYFTVSPDEKQIHLHGTENLYYKQ